MFIPIIISTLVLVSCHSLRNAGTMNVFYPHDDSYCFQMTVPKTNQYGWFEVNGDRCYVFHYPLKNRADTSRIFLSHFGFEECDCSIHYTVDKIRVCYNDSVLAEHFISSQGFMHTFIVQAHDRQDTLVFRSPNITYDTSKYALIEYLGYISPIKYVSDTAFTLLKNSRRYTVKEWSKHTKMVYIDGATLEDTLSLEGYDERNLYWKDVKINSRNINVGCVNILSRDKKQISQLLSSLKMIRISSIDTTENALILLP